MKDSAGSETASLSLFRGHFCLVWVLRACSAMGGQILAFSVALQLYQTSGSALDLGFLGLVQFLPTLAFALPAGHLVDRFGSGRVALAIQLLNVSAAMLLLIPGLRAHMLSETLFMAALMTGASRAFEHPINTALLPSVVADRYIARAVAWTTSVAKTATIAGPILGGAIFAMGATWSYGAALLLFLAAAGVAAGLRLTGSRSSTPALGLGSVFAGAAVIWRDRVLSGVMILDLFAVLLGGATALLPIYALNVLHTGPQGLGIMRAAPGIGALGAGLWLSYRPVNRNTGTILLAATALFGVATCGFGLSKNYFLSLLMLFGIGATDMMSIHIRSALLQLRTPPQLRGRVGAVNGLFVSSSNQIGAFESGLTAYWFGAVPAVTIGGLLTIAMTGAIAFTFKALRRIDKLHNSQCDSSSEQSSHQPPSTEA